MKQLFLGFLALVQILIGMILLLSSTFSPSNATVYFYGNPGSQWHTSQNATISRTASPPPASVPIGSITINRHSH